MQFFWNFFEQLIPQEATTVSNSHEEKIDLISRSRDRSAMASSPEVKDASQSSEYIALEGEVISVPVEDTVYEVLKQSNFLNQIIKVKFDCETLLMDSPFSSQSSPLRAQKVYEKALGNRGRVNLSVWMDDLTRHKVDAVINAANGDLAHGGGLALSIVTAGGEDIKRESKQIISKRGKINTGDVVHTSGGKLPCNYVIHAVGPECNHQAYDKAHEKCRALLKKAITNILNFVINEKLFIKSVAIPALSSGLFRFPLKECAEIIVKSIKEFGEKDQFGAHLKEIHLVNNDEPTVIAMKSACEDIFESSAHGFSLNNTEKYFPSKCPNSITVNNVFLEILNGHIEEQKTDIIVNSISQSRDLTEGNISKAILKRAGDGLQHEIKQKSPSSLIKTRGHRLPCQFVFHVIVPQAKTFEADKEFRRVVLKCLEEASRERLSSISLPAIGTGILGFQKNEVANIMIGEVLHFANHFLGTRLHVCIVIYPADNYTFQAFLDELKLQRAKIETSDYTSKRPNDVSVLSEKSDLKLKKPSIHLGGRNSCHVEEAVSWIQATLQLDKGSLLIENNHIFYFGAQEHETLIQKLDCSVSLIENLKNGRAHIKITGLGLDIIKAALEIEKLLCSVQEQYESSQMEELIHLADLLRNEPNGKKGKSTIPEVCDIKKTIAASNQIYQDKSKEFEKAGLLLLKMEQIQNPILKIIYQSKRDATEEKRKQNVISNLYHQVPAQFCNLVCKIGFQRIYSHSPEQRYGAGIYFYKSVRSLQANSKQNLTADKYIYIFQADVITGVFTKGKESYIVPPPVDTDYMDLFDSVADYTSHAETFVIFNSSQALPLYLYTCAKKETFKM